MQSFLLYLIGAVGLGLMVFVHELGHFVAARIAGVHVEVFSLGWGPRLVGFTRNGTTYQVSWFLIGGYCKMRGEIVPGSGGKTSPAADASTPDAPPAPAHPAGSFFAASPWRRIFISAFGPLFNLVFAAIVFTVTWWAGFTIVSPDNRIIVASDYAVDKLDEKLPAAQAGLRTGDRVTAIDGRPVAHYMDIRQAAVVSPGRRLLFTVERRASAPGSAAQVLSIPITPALDRKSGAGRIGIYAWYDPVVAGVSAGGPADVAGLRSGDRIVSIAGRPVANSLDMDTALLADRPARVEVVCERGGQTLAETLVPDYSRLPPGTTAGLAGAALGIGYPENQYRSPRLGLPGAFARGVGQTGETVALVVKSIGLLFRGVSLRDAVAGPLRITRTIGEATAAGFTTGMGEGLQAFFSILSFLSVSLFLMNLLPIPALDGGQILLFLVEAARRRAVDTKLYVRLQIIGFSLLIVLFVFITVNDYVTGR